MELISLLSDFREKVKNPGKLICQYQDERNSKHDHSSHSHGHDYDENNDFDYQPPQVKRMIDLQNEDLCPWKIFSDIKDFVVIPVAIFGGIVGVVLMFCVVSRLIGKGSIRKSKKSMNCHMILYNFYLECLTNFEKCLAKTFSYNRLWDQYDITPCYLVLAPWGVVGDVLQ